MRIRLAIALSFLMLSSCGGNSGDSREAGTPECLEPVLAADIADVPGELQLDRHATITEVDRKKGALGVTAISDLPVVELYPPLARAILDAGYSIVSSDNEGFEAEIFFGDESVTGAYRLREAPCGDQVIVKLLFDRGRGK